MKLRLFKNATYPQYNLAPAGSGESIVFGVASPNKLPSMESIKLTPDQLIENTKEWLQFLQSSGIKRVVNLLEESVLLKFKEKTNIDLLGVEKSTFGIDNVLWTPVENFTFISGNIFFDKIFPFLQESERYKLPVAVHCFGGSGRTGQILALWLRHGRGMGVDEAVKNVLDTGAMRNIFEAEEKSGLNRNEFYSVMNNSKDIVSHKKLRLRKF